MKSDYELTVRIRGQGKQKTADRVFYETTQVRKKYDILLFVFLRVQGPGGGGGGGACSSDKSALHTYFS